MRKILYACVALLPMSAHAATMCEALKSIDAASVTGFKDLPTHPAKGMPNGVPEAIIPGGSSPSLGRGMGTRSNEMQFSVTFVDAKNAAMLNARYAEAKKAVTECLPGTKAVGGDQYQTPNGMRIELAQDLGGSHVEVFQGNFTFVSTAKPSVASEEQTPDGFVQALYNRYYRNNVDQTSIPDDQVYSPSLLAATKHNTDRNGGPIYDGDPFIDSQEADVSAVQVVLVSNLGDKAEVLANVTNGGEKKRIKFRLVRMNGAWKIDDIGNLRKVLASAKR